MVKKERLTCNICGKSFNSRKQMNQHKHDVHDNIVNSEDMTKEELTKSHGKRSSKKLSTKLIIVIIGVGILVAITGGIGAYYYTTSSANNNTLSVYINGHKISGMNYRDIKLNAHDEIAIVYGLPSTQPTTIPSSYAFPKGL